MSDFEIHKSSNGSGLAIAVETGVADQMGESYVSPDRLGSMLNAFAGLDLEESTLIFLAKPQDESEPGRPHTESERSPGVQGFRNTILVDAVAIETGPGPRLVQHIAAEAMNLHWDKLHGTKLPRNKAIGLGSFAGSFTGFSLAEHVPGFIAIPVLAAGGIMIGSAVSRHLNTRRGRADAHEVAMNHASVSSHVLSHLNDISFANSPRSGHIHSKNMQNLAIDPLQERLEALTAEQARAYYEQNQANQGPETTRQQAL